MKVYTDTGKAILEAVDNHYCDIGLLLSINFFREGVWEDLTRCLYYHTENLMSLNDDQKIWFALMVAEEHSVDITDVLDKVFDNGYEACYNDTKERLWNTINYSLN
mgnify:FL=1